jgi:hypothetical protein
MPGRAGRLERELFITMSVSSNINHQADIQFENSKPTYDVVCSWCGTVIRSSNSETPEQMCLICHARMLNDYFRRLRQTSGDKRH